MLKDKLVKAFEEGILITVKYGIIIVVIIYTFNFMNGTRQMAINGNSAALAIQELQSKGWLPKFPIEQKEK